jgi:type II secretory pathway pseudopilin PulG
MVEIIAVIAIIALLAAAVTGGVIVATKKAAIKATEGLFQRLDIAIGMYFEDYGAYPPDRNPNNPGSGGWDPWHIGDNIRYVNTPPETLWYFLAGMYEHPNIDNSPPSGFRENLARKTAYMSFDERDLRRTGKVFWMSGTLQNQPDAYDPNDSFPEIVDIWGNPIQYVRKDSLVTGLKPQGNVDAYDLVSRGPDRITGNPYYQRNVQVAGKYPNRDNITNFEMK